MHLTQMVTLFEKDGKRTMLHKSDSNYTFFAITISTGNPNIDISVTSRI